ncbi:hypothetical protein LB503_007088 [Fusarium chuoi]|nr:hypothetical protein LB503_007088 [Fusarium chuoi]
MAVPPEPSFNESSANIADEKVDFPSDLEPGEMLRPGYQADDTSSDTIADGGGHTVNQNVESQHDHYETREITTRQGEAKTCKINWSKARKWTVTLTLSWVCFAVAFASAVITPGIAGVVERFDASSEVALLTITLFVYGFGIGPLVFSPLSELYGRRIIYVLTFGMAVIFIVPCAVAQNIETLLVCRAIDGIAMSVPVANTCGDLKNEEFR